MRSCTWLAAMLVGCSLPVAMATPDPHHLIDPRTGGDFAAAGVKGLQVCDSFYCTWVTVNVDTEDWKDQAGTLHSDGCMARWDYGGFDVKGSLLGGSMLRWRLNPLDKETYY